MRRLLNRLRAFVNRQKKDQDLQEELAAHLRLDAEERIAAGIPSEEARQAAQRDFGNVLKVTEDTRAAWGWTSAEQWLQDLRYALRNMAHRPMFAVIMVLTLALGIGANTAIFSIVNAALLRPLPYPDPDRLVALFSLNPSPNGGLWVVAPADFADWRRDSTSFQHLAGYSGGNVSVLIGERPESLTATRVTWNFFDTFGAAPLLGRGFEPSDETSLPAIQKIVLSHRVWQSRFAGDMEVIGRQIKTTAGSAMIVGVMPPEFRFPEYAEVWVPMGCCGEMTRRATRYWQVVGRLQDGVTLEAARSEMQSIAQRLSDVYPEDNRNWSVEIVPLQQALVRDVRPALWILMGAVGLVIVIACANVAGLTLVRSATRRRELAVRHALGADRWRLIRQLFVEGLLISTAGAVAGLLLARWGIDAFFSLLPQTAWTSLVRFREVPHLDSTVLIFTGLLAAFTTVLLTLSPAWDSLKVALAESARSIRNTTRREHRLYKVLVVGQFACAIVLLAGTGLLVRSFVRMLDVELGYDPRGLVIMSLLPQLAGPDQRLFVAEALERIKASPGVESAAVMSRDRFGQLNLLFNREDKPFPNGDVMVRYGPVTADYFRVLESPLIAGRGFETRDSANAPLVAVVNEKLATEYFSGENAIGKIMTIAYNNQRLSMEIVGVAGNVRQDSPQEPVKPEILMHWPQLPWIEANLVIRTKGDWAATAKFVQEAIWSVNRNLPPSRVQTLDQVLSGQVATPRLYMILFTLFSAVAVVLAALGIYGLIACIVGRRTNEMAIRVAIGARRGNILGMVIGEGLRLSVAGIFLGLACTLALARLMRSLLFEVSPNDPLTFSGVAILLLGVALAACYIPARRAARTDPTVALRHE